MVSLWFRSNVREKEVKAPPLLSVSRVALSAMANPGALPQPVVAVWADLTAVFAVAGQSPLAGGLRVLHLVETGQSWVGEEGFAAMVEVLVADAVRGYYADGSAYVDIDQRRSWRLRLPSTAASLLAARPGGVAALPLVLMDGHPPSDPELRVLEPSGAEAFTVAALPHFTEVSWPQVTAVPEQPVQVWTPEQQDPLTVDPMRDLLWAAAGGLALNQPGAAAMTWALSMYVSACATAGGPDLPVKAARLLRLLDGFDLAHLSAVVREPDSGLVAWPAVMAEQVAAFDSDAGVEDLFVAVSRLTGAPSGSAESDPVPLPGVRASQLLAANPDLGLDRVVHFAVALLAAAAARMSDGLVAVHGPRWSTPSFLLGVWLDYDTPPWWAIAATQHGLLHHDVGLLVDLVHAHPVPVSEEAAGDAEADEKACSPMLVRVLHALVPALDDLGVDAHNAAVVLTSSDVTPTCIDDIVVLAAALAYDPAAGPSAEECPACEAVDRFEQAGWSSLRVAESAASLLALMADISVNDLPVGEPEWLAHRSRWLRRWLSEAVSPGASDEVTQQHGPDAMGNPPGLIGIPGVSDLGGMPLVPGTPLLRDLTQPSEHPMRQVDQVDPADLAGQGEPQDLNPEDPGDAGSAAAGP